MLWGSSQEAYHVVKQELIFVEFEFHEKHYMMYALVFVLNDAYRQQC